MLTLSLSRVSTCILCSWDLVAARCTASRTYVRHLSSGVVVVGWLFGLVVVVMVVVVILLFYKKKWDGYGVVCAGAGSAGGAGEAGV